MADNKDIVVKGLELQLDMIASGLPALFQVITPVVVDGVSYAQPDLAKKVESFRTPYTGKRGAKRTLAQMLLEVNNVKEEAKKFVASLETTAASVLGASNPLLAQLGYKPKKERKKLTVEEKALAVAQARVTREQRRTLGAKQRAAIVAPPVDQIVVNRDGTSKPVTPADTAKKS